MHQSTSRQSPRSADYPAIRTSGILEGSVRRRDRSLSTTVEQEVEALAADLGTLAYDERLKLAAGFPAVVLFTPDAKRAESLEHKLRARGHNVIFCSTSQVVLSSAMISLRRFRLEDDALVAADLADARLPWSDVLALIRATDRRRLETTAVVKEKKFDLTRTLVTGGLIRSKTNQREVSSSIDESEQVLYIFRRSRQTPWILRERGTRYGALDSQLAPSTLSNFSTAVDQLKARAVLALYDDRLVTRRRSHRQTAGKVAGVEKVSTPQDLDLLAHLIAAWIASRDCANDGLEVT